MPRSPKFRVGQRVKVVNYGHLLHAHHDDFKKLMPDAVEIAKDEHRGVSILDVMPHLVGLTGTVIEVTEGVKGFSYALDGIPGKSAWFKEGQLE